MIKAVLWDLDGTLVDSAEFHWWAWRDIMAAEGAPISYEQFVQSFGKRNDLILAGWFGAGIDPARAERLGETKEAHFRDLVRRNGVSPLPGVRDWVTRLHEAGWRHAIATSAPRANLDTVVDAMGMRHLFSAGVAAEDVTHGKPHPEVFLVAASRLGAEPHRSIVVEDAPTGIEAGRRAGMRTIGVSLMHNLSQADVCVGTLEELAEDVFDRLLDCRDSGFLTSPDALPRGSVEAGGIRDSERRGSS